MSEITFAVYDPPKPGFPYLAVMISPNGDITARGFVSGDDAERFNVQMAAEAGKRFNTTPRAE
ncbi:hypothetical protein BH09PSE1_BH09PSE1_15620 [soil metagenome]